jgi:hypothetical protein
VTTPSGEKFSGFIIPPAKEFDSKKPKTSYVAEEYMFGQ